MWTHFIKCHQIFRSCNRRLKICRYTETTNIKHQDFHHLDGLHMLHNYVWGNIFSCPSLSLATFMTRQTKFQKEKTEKSNARDVEDVSWIRVISHHLSETFAAVENGEIKNSSSGLKYFRLHSRIRSYSCARLYVHLCRVCSDIRSIFGWSQP